MTEKQIEQQILTYLDRLGAFVCNIEMSAKPVRIGNQIKMIPFKSKYFRKGMSDILCFFKGKCYALEVKTPDAHKAIKNKIEKFKTTPPNLISKSNLHLYRQWLFIQSVKHTGNDGGFVSSIEDVNAILNI